VTLRNLFLFAFAPLFMLMFAGCQTAPKQKEERDIAADTKAINALLVEYFAAFNSNDAAAAAATFADDGIWMGPNAAAIEGKQAIQTAAGAALNEYSYQVASTPLETQVAGDWAYDRGNYTVTVTPKSGKPMERSSKYLTIYKRQPDGSWKCYRDIWNSNSPPPSAAGKKK
jgi:uncharacterized protein (TIGR02246 family)